MNTILFAHPQHTSFNGEILQAVETQLQNQHQPYQTIDLYADGFSPVLTAAELPQFFKGEIQDPLVQKYQRMLQQTQRLITIFPIWFNEYPAIFKGFFDRVCQGTFAFDYAPHGVQPKLHNIQSALIITTSHAPQQVLETVQGDLINRQVIGHLMKTLGIPHSQWLDCGGMLTNTAADKDAFLAKVRAQL